MRRLAYLAIVLGSAAAGSAGAQTFVSKLNIPAAPQSSAAILADAAFAPRAPGGTADPIGRLADTEAYEPGKGLMRWNSGALRLSNGETGAIDSIRVSVGGALHTPDGVPLHLDRAQFQADAYEISLVRDWKALSFGGKAFNVDLSPHAGVGVTNYGGSAEAGAQVKISRDERAARQLREMGIGDGTAFGNMSRWYLYAAVSGRAVGLNMLRGDAGGWDRAGWTTDATSALMGDVQLGVGWRKGVLQSSFGLIHREVKGQHMIWGQQTRDDTIAAFSLSIKPQR
jgi:hypothetical protein